MWAFIQTTSLLYGVGYVTKAHHFCPEVRTGGIYCFETEDPDKTRRSRAIPEFSWVLEVEANGKIIERFIHISRGRGTKMVQPEQVRGVKFLPPLCVQCGDKVSQGLLTVSGDKLYPFCSHHWMEKGYTWGEFKYDGVEIHVSPI